MAETVIQTKGGPLTENDFEGEAPSPGTSDARYSGAGKKALESLAERVRKMMAEGEEK